MHSYLRAIGYSRIQSRMEAEQLIKQILEKSTERRITARSDTALLIECSYECAEGIGITVRGEVNLTIKAEQPPTVPDSREINAMEAEKSAQNSSILHYGESVSETPLYYTAEEGSFHMENYFPYFRGTNISMHEDVFISKRVDTEAYNGMCDDSRFGVSLIFYLQNAVDYLDVKYRNPENSLYPVTLSALSLEGKILLPAFVSVKEKQLITTSSKKRTDLIAEAKKGNQEAIQTLTVDDLDLYSSVSERARTEDIFSIVDTTFIPFGAESDVYNLLGRIESFRLLTNQETKEEIYTMQISCNDMNFDVCINKEDLLGEPAVGRRFRGTIWMQGFVDFA